jgi:hypothetical protein
LLHASATEMSAAFVMFDDTELSEVLRDCGTSAGVGRGVRADHCSVNIRSCR